MKTGSSLLSYLMVDKQPIFQIFNSYYYLAHFGREKTAELISFIRDSFEDYGYDVHLCGTIVNTLHKVC